MRTTRGLFARLCRLEHLEAAAAATVRGKRRRPDVAWYLFRLDEELAWLRDQLQRAAYRPAAYELVSIRDPKPRLIARVPIGERVLHTALVMLMQPIFEPAYSPADYACRPGFGTHRALLRLAELMTRHRFVVHLDVRAYYPSIDREIMKRLLEKRIRDPDFMALVVSLLDASCDLYRDPLHRRRAGLEADWPPPGRGLPVGSSLSQLLATHIYLNAFDHWVKRQLKVSGYLRYGDDLFLFGDRRAEMRFWRGEVGAWLLEHRQLRLKHPQAPVLSCRGHLDALGHRLRRGCDIRPLPRAGRRFQHKLRQCLYAPRRGPGRAHLERSIASYRGVLLP